MATCSASQRITEVKGEIKFLETKLEEIPSKLEEKRKELAVLESQFKIPGFFRNLPLEIPMAIPYCYARGFDRQNAIHVWMNNEIQKLGLWTKLNHPPHKPVFTFHNTRIETMYNYCVENYEEMSGYPLFPEEFIIK